MKDKYIIILVAIVFNSCTSTQIENRTGLSLQDAIEQSAKKIATELPSNSRVAIVAFESANENLSEYIMEEITGALFDQGIEVADRQNLAYVYKELNFQMSGDVSDETAKSIGKFLAADMVITGQLIYLDSIYRYRTSAIHVETAVRASVTRFDVRSDDTMRRMVAALANQQNTVRVSNYGVSEDITPQTAGRFLDRGIMYASQGEYEKAIADFTEAIRLNPNMSAAYALRARVLNAKVSFVTDTGDDFSWVNTILIEGHSITTEQRRAYELAINDYTHAIRLEPNNVQFYMERCIIYTYVSDYGSAILDLNQVIIMDPNNALAYYNRGLIYHHDMDNSDQAILDYTQSIRLNPISYESYFNRGVAYGNKGELEKAIADWEMVLRISPNRLSDSARRYIETARRRLGY